MGASREVQFASSEPPKYLVWTRMQAEAGQGLELIVQRKERERREGRGRFFWGVGNAPSVMISALARTETPVDVVFSKMKSKPKAVDQAPTTTVIWRRYIDCNGSVRPLPPSALITSRGESLSGMKKVHYALECYCAKPLALDDDGTPFDHISYRNAGGTGAPVGASQVTSLLVPNEAPSVNESPYTVDMIGSLVGSYWVKLVDPLPLTPSKASQVDTAHVERQDWSAFIEELLEDHGVDQGDRSAPLLL